MNNPNARRFGFSELRYNAAAARYVTPQGKFLSGAKVREVVDNEITATGARMVRNGDALKDAAQSFKAGNLSQDEYSQKVREWRDVLASDIKANHLLNRAAGVGGLHALSPADFGATGAALKQQYGFLNNFAIECAANPDLVLSQVAGKQPFDNRVALYAEAGRGTFEKGQKAAHERAGYKYKSNVEEPDAHHCSGANSCPEHTARGRVPIDDATYKMPGFRRCHTKCKCLTAYFFDAA